MRRAIVCALALAAGCGHLRPPAPAAEASATIHNAIDFGLGSSIYFAVSRIDGAVVHRKFDRDSSIRTAPGLHDLRVRYYFEGVSGAAEGAAECRVEIDVQEGADYYLEGATDDGRWRARLVDAAGTAEWPCTFPGGSASGAVEGSARSQAVSSRPRGSLARTELPAAAVEAAAAGQAAVVEGGAAGAASEDRRPSTDPAAPSGRVSDDSGVVAASTAATGAVASTGSAASWGGGTFRKVLDGRGHWGCPANLFRVSAIEKETIALGGNERIRLLGVEPLDGGRFARALESLVDHCVSLEFDQALAGKILRDRDGSLRAYVIDESGELVNAAVIRRGGATVDPRSRCRRLGELMAAQSEANAAGSTSAER